MIDLLQANYAANEIMKVSDFNYGEDKGVTNIDAVLGDLLASTADVLGQGLTVVERSSPSMNVDIEAGWAFRVAGDTVVRSASVAGPVPVPAADPTQQRIDILEIRRKITDFDTEQRAFKDPGTGTVSYQNHDTKSRYELEAQVVGGTPGSGVAPDRTAGWMKLAEIVVPAAATQILDADIKNVTAGKDGEASAAWTAETTSTYKLQRLSQIKTIIRAKHSETGDHENDVIKGQHVDWGVGADQVDADLLPIGTQIDSNPTGGTATSLPNTTKVRNALVEVFARLIDLSGVGNDAVKSRHIDWGVGAGQVNGTEGLPIGTMWIFDANNAGGAGSPPGTSGAWVDDSTIPGWYACVAGNSDHGCPDMVDRFVMGKVVAGAGSTGGTNDASHTHGTDSKLASITLAHTHTVNSHVHSLSSHTHPGPSHTHGLVNGRANFTFLSGTSRFYIDRVNASYTADYEFFLTGTWNVNTGSYARSTAAQLSGTTDSEGTGNTGGPSTPNTGGAGAGTNSQLSDYNAAHTHTTNSQSAATDNRPACYSAIYIRKCA